MSKENSPDPEFARRWRDLREKLGAGRLREIFGGKAEELTRGRLGKVSQIVQGFQVLAREGEDLNYLLTGSPARPRAAARLPRLLALLADIQLQMQDHPERRERWEAALLELEKQIAEVTESERGESV